MKLDVDLLVAPLDKWRPKMIKRNGPDKAKRKKMEKILPIYLKYIDQSIEEVHGTPDPFLFMPLPGIVNTVGNLGLHIAGNLSHYIGMGLGHHDYQRNREFEFEAKDIAKSIIIEHLLNAKTVVNTSLSNLDNQQLAAKYPDLTPWHNQTTEFVVTALLSHLSYHVGQMNYLRRIILAFEQ